MEQLKDEISKYLNLMNRYCRNHKIQCLFAITFTFFFSLGMSLSRLNTPSTNIYFGADNARAFGDIIKITGTSHYRIKVHPLMLILIQPLTLLLNAVINHAPTTEVVAGSIAGAVNAVNIYQIVGRYVKTEKIRLGLVAIYACSFSTMIFTTVPETFMLASVFIVMYWNYLLKLLSDNEPLDKYDIGILIFFGITNFGFTLTNYAGYFIGLLSLLIFIRQNKTKKFIQFIVINGINGLCILILAKFQQKAWKGDTPFFVDSLLVWKNSPNDYEETHYMDFSVSFEKFKTEFVQTYIHALFGGRIKTAGNTDYTYIGFSNTPIFIKVLSGLFLTAVVAAVIISIRKRKYIRESILLAVTLGTNLCLHFIYGSGEAFMYTPHFFFLNLIIISIGISVIGESSLLTKIITGFSIIEAILNIITYRQLIRLVIPITGVQDYSVKVMILKSLTVCLIMCISLYLIEKKANELIYIKKHCSYKEYISYGIIAYSIYIIGVAFCIWRNV